jgi:C4-type Zn-finger protein
MSEAKFKPPTCPICNANLFIVYEKIYNVWYFDIKKGIYRKTTTTQILCPDCNSELKTIFPDGIENYESKVKKQ